MSRWSRHNLRQTCLPSHQTTCLAIAFIVGWIDIDTDSGEVMIAITVFSYFPVRIFGLFYQQAIHKSLNALTGLRLFLFSKVWP